MAAATDREKALDVALGAIEKQFGKGAIMRMGEGAKQKIAIIPTGAIGLDVALGTGGFPRGRVVEIFGPESSGKTSLALHAIAEAQKAGGVAAFIDAEHALDPIYAAAIGVDMDALLVSQPDTGEQALEITDTLVRSGAVDLLVIDSVAALTPRAEIEGEMGDSHVGLQARLMSQALRKLSGNLHRSRTCCIFINQLREKIGVMFGSPETTPGGRALKFYSSVRLDIRRIESLKDGTDFVGNRVRVKVVKNKCVAAGTQIFDPVAGLTRSIEQIVDEGHDLHVWAADKKGLLHQRSVTELFDQGSQQVIGLRLRNGTVLRVTPDHRILTEEGWREAGSLVPGDRVARPRQAGAFGTDRPFTPDEARLIGYLIGDGYVGGKTPVAFINTEATLQDDVRRLAGERGCKVTYTQGGLYASMSHRPGERNEVLALTRQAGIYGHLAWQKQLPAALLQDGIDPEVLGNALFGIWESDGWISREQNGGIRAGFCTTSEQLAWQIHWALLRWGITTSVTEHQPGLRRSLIDGRRIQGRRTAYQVRVSGLDNIEQFSSALPMWGPKGVKLLGLLQEQWTTGRRGSRAGYLAAPLFREVVTHLESQGITAMLAASLIELSPTHGQGGFRAVLGGPRIRRDRLSRLAHALDDPFLTDVLQTDVYFEAVHAVEDLGERRTFDLRVDELHNFVADGVVVHNCAPPFRQTEFDIMFGQGISKEGSLLDMGVEHGIVRKAGAWFTYDGEQLGQGRENARNFLKEHAEVADEIYKRTVELLGLVPTDVTGDEALAETEST